MRNLIIIISFFISMAAVSCGSSSTGHDHRDTASAVTKTAKKYTCPMHADVVADKPGTCPKCKMKLV